MIAIGCRRSKLRHVIQGLGFIWHARVLHPWFVAGQHRARLAQLFQPLGCFFN